MYYTGKTRSLMIRVLEIRGLFFAGSFAQRLFPVMNYERKLNQEIRAVKKLEFEI
jgi:hypothetical protein